MRAFVPLACLLFVLTGCSCGDGGGGGAGSCDALHAACTSPDSCPGISCKCPGSKFNAIVQACRGGCCAATCDEACGTTTDSCSSVSCSDHGTCMVESGAAVCHCDVGYVLAVNNACVPEGSECTSHEQCSDANPCSDDYCSQGSCSHSPTAEASCDDGNACTENDACAAGLCLGTFTDADGDGQAATSCGGPDCNERGSEGAFERQRARPGR